MSSVRRVCWAASWAGWGLQALSVVLLVALTVTAGDWSLTPEPWTTLALTLLVCGLVITAVFVLALDVSEPLGWRRLVAVPPALFVLGTWTLALLIGVPATGLGAEHDPRTVLYSLPQLAIALIVATDLLALPLALVRLRRSP